MLMQIQGQQAYCYTGGKPFDASLPVAVFIHGAQNDHSVWQLQSRYFAHHGHAVLALDLPGHGRSGGAARVTVEEMSDWVLAVLDGAGVTGAGLIGHSMGALIALETAARAPRRVRALALLGAAYPMKVSDTLLDAARENENSAIDMINLWSHSSTAQKPSFPGPGSSVMGGAKRLMQRLAQINPAQLLHTDFSACNSYANGAEAAASVACPTLLLAGTRDQMTPLKSARQLAGVIAGSSMTLVDSGHAMMAEQPDAVLDALFGFMQSHAC